MLLAQSSLSLDNRTEFVEIFFLLLLSFFLMFSSLSPPARLMPSLRPSSMYESQSVMICWEEKSKEREKNQHPRIHTRGCCGARVFALIIVARRNLRALDARGTSSHSRLAEAHSRLVHALEVLKVPGYEYGWTFVQSTRTYSTLKGGEKVTMRLFPIGNRNIIHSQHDRVRVRARFLVQALKGYFRYLPSSHLPICPPSHPAGVASRHLS